MPAKAPFLVEASSCSSFLQILVELQRFSEISMVQENDYAEGSLHSGTAKAEYNTRNRIEI